MKHRASRMNAKDFKIWKGLISELLVNVSAGLLLIGVAAIFSEEEPIIKAYVLFINFSSATLSLAVAYFIRREKFTR